MIRFGDFMGWGPYGTPPGNHGRAPSPFVKELRGAFETRRQDIETRRQDIGTRVHQMLEAQLSRAARVHARTQARTELVVALGWRKTLTLLGDPALEK